MSKTNLQERAETELNRAERAFYEGDLHEYVNCSEDVEATWSWDGALLGVTLIKRYEDCIVKVDTRKRAVIATAGARSFGYFFNNNIMYHMAKAIDEEVERLF